jgi:hypothetical protein
MAPNNTTTPRFEIMAMRIELGWIGIWSIWSVSVIHKTYLGGNNPESQGCLFGWIGQLGRHVSHGPQLQNNNNISFGNYGHEEWSWLNWVMINLECFGDSQNLPWDKHSKSQGWLFTQIGIRCWVIKQEAEWSLGTAHSAFRHLLLNTREQFCSPFRWGLTWQNCHLGSAQ